MTQEAVIDTTKLSPTERAELHRCETVIDRGLKAYIEVGQALSAINDGKLYRETHSSFEDYVKAKWGLSRGRAYQYIHAEGVGTKFDSEMNEYAAATLYAVDEKQRPAVFKKATAVAEKQGRSTPNAADIKAVAPAKKRKAAPEGKKLNGKSGKVLKTFEDHVRSLMADAAKVIGWEAIAISLNALAGEAKAHKKATAEATEKQAA